MHSALRATVHRLKSQFCSTEQRDHYHQFQTTHPALCYHLSPSSMSPVLQACGISHQLSPLTNIWNVFLSTWGIFLLLSTHWAHSYSSLNTSLKMIFSLMPSIAFIHLLIALFLICCQKCWPPKYYKELFTWLIPSFNTTGSFSRSWTLSCVSWCSYWVAWDQPYVGI